MRNSECGMDALANERTASINSAFRISHSAFGSAVKHRRLFGAPGRREAKMLVRARRGAPAARRAGEEALLHEERLVHLLERARVLAHGGGGGGEGHPPPFELLDDGLQDPAGPVVESEVVAGEPVQ